MRGLLGKNRVPLLGRRVVPVMLVLLVTRRLLVLLVLAVLAVVSFSSWQRTLLVLGRLLPRGLRQHLGLLRFRGTLVLPVRTPQMRLLTLTLVIRILLDIILVRLRIMLVGRFLQG
jgi:hypothetical protein